MYAPRPKYPQLQAEMTLDTCLVTSTDTGNVRTPTSWQRYLTSLKNGLLSNELNVCQSQYASSQSLVQLCLRLQERSYVVLLSFVMQSS